MSVIATLRKICIEAQARHEQFGFTTPCEVALKLSGRKARGERIRLFPKGGPMGEVVAVYEHMTVGMFSVAEVLAFLDRAEAALAKEEG